jgi:rhodanese-related sulfurtransferase
MVDDVNPVEVAKQLRAAPGSVLLLDVREPWERELAVIEPSVHIPMNDIAERSTELPKDRKIVVYCHGGTRSAMVAGYLEHHGFPAVENLAGGIEAWSVQVDPKVPRYR